MLFGERLPIDRLWMDASGKSLPHAEEQAGLLVAVWQVKEVVENPAMIWRERIIHSVSGGDRELTDEGWKALIEDHTQYTPTHPAYP